MFVGVHPPRRADQKRGERDVGDRYSVWIWNCLPVPADYDGYGKADITVFRDGAWYLQRSTAGFTGVTFGTNTDKPVPNAFVP